MYFYVSCDEINYNIIISSIVVSVLLTNLWLNVQYKEEIIENSNTRKTSKCIRRKENVICKCYVCVFYYISLALFS